MKWFSYAIMVVGLVALLVSGGLPCLAGGETEQSEEEGEDLEALLMELFPTGLKGLHKVEASLYAGPISSEWEKVLGVSPTEVDKELKARVGAIPGLAADGEMLLGDPWLYLDIEPLVERSEKGEPTRVFVSVGLRLDEWVLVNRPDTGEGSTAVIGTTWQDNRLLSGAPGKVGEQVEAAAEELLDIFERSYRKSNAGSEKSESD